MNLLPYLPFSSVSKLPRIEFIARGYFSIDSRGIGSCWIDSESARWTLHLCQIPHVIVSRRTEENRRKRMRFCADREESNAPVVSFFSRSTRRQGTFARFPYAWKSISFRGISSVRRLDNRRFERRTLYGIGGFQREEAVVSQPLLNVRCCAHCRWKWNKTTLFPLAFKAVGVAIEFKRTSSSSLNWMIYCKSLGSCSKGGMEFVIH